MMVHSRRVEASCTLYTVLEAIQIGLAAPPGAFGQEKLVHRKTLHPALQVPLVTSTIQGHAFHRGKDE